MRSTSRYVAAIAGTGGGKTAIGPLWLAGEIAKNPGGLFMVVAPTTLVLNRATLPMLLETFSGTDLEGTYIPSSSKYVLPTGGTIWVLSAHNPTGLEGGQFDAVWFDEAGQAKYDAYVAIQGRLGQKMGRLLITTTPYGRNWLYHRFYKKWQANDPDYDVIQWASNANPAYPDEEFERARATYSPERAAMRYEGKFVKMQGLVYPAFSRCVLPEHRAPVQGRNLGGIDWGWNNPFCALCATLYIDEDGRDILYVWFERYKRFTASADHRAAIPEARYYADPSRPDSIDELNRSDRDIVVCRGPNEILFGIDAVNERIYTGRLAVSPRCRALIAEASQYAYPERDDEAVGDLPVDEFNHALDALRYLCAGIKREAVGRDLLESEQYRNGRPI
jgi:phage terminase large subunit